MTRRLINLLLLLLGVGAVAAGARGHCLKFMLLRPG